LYKSSLAVEETGKQYPFIS